jgi:arylsulfatase A-like enzyme/Tfp pilus assembly protein PilF
VKARGAAVALLVAAAAGIWWFASASRSRQDLPAGTLRGYNVLLVTIDTLRADRIGAYGNASGLTPTIDRLASEGLRFDSMRAQVPLTLPSHASLLTGRIPPRHGVRDNGTYRLDPSHETLATALKSAGYATGAFVGAFVLDARFGLARGFDLYDDQYGERPALGRVEVVERRAEEVTTRATGWIRAAQGPWFAWVHVYDPHEPYAPPEPMASRYTSAPYDGEVAYVDATLGQMIGQLRSAGQLARTLVVVASDHGEGLGDHDERTHGLFAYDSTLRVPLVMWCRERLQPGVIEDSAGLVDVAPTIADLLAVPWAATDGRSLRPRLAGEEAASSAQALDSAPTYFEALNANLTRNWAPLTGVVAGGLKLVDLPVPELYDLAADPAETQNLYARRPEDARRLERMLDTLAGNARAPAGANVDTETAARLRSLGYVVSQPPTQPRRFTAADDPKNLVSLDTALDEAMKISGRGDHATAITMLQDVIQKRPDLPLAYDRLAFVLRSSGRLPEAISVLEQAASKGFADAPVLVTLGTMLQEADRLERSVAVLEAAVGMNGQDLEARNRLGTAYARMGRADEAEREFTRVLEEDPQSAEALTNLGILFLGINRAPAAIEVLRKAIAADPLARGASNALAAAYAKSGDLQQAVRLWRQLVEQRPDDADLLYNLGTALLQLKQPTEALPFLERFVAAAPPQYAADVDRIKRIIAELSR